VTTAVTYSPVNNFGGFAKDASQGGGTAMTTTLGTTKPVGWNDKPEWLEDTSLRGVMTDGPFATLQGVTIGELTFPESPLYIDSFGFPLMNILGDLTTTGGAAPYTNAFSLLNSLTGQPSNHTFEEFYGPGTHSARLFTGLCFNEVVIGWDVQKKLLYWSGKAACYMSTAASATPTDAQSTVLPIPSWRMLLGIGGPASGGTQDITCKSGKITLTREVEPEWTGMNSQLPYIIQRGALRAKFDDWLMVTKDEGTYNLMSANTRPQVQLVFDNGLAAAAHGALQLDAQVASFRSVQTDNGGKAVMWKSSGKFEANTTNAGTSGGQSPLKATLTNAIATGTYQ
jgi:hypothetical protein